MIDSTRFTGATRRLADNPPLGRPLARARRRPDYAASMSFGLGHGRRLDEAPGVVGIAPAEFPPLPDAILTDPESGRLDPRRWFADPTRPFELEIGCGKGGFILQ